MLQSMLSAGECSAWLQSAVCQSASLNSCSIHLYKHNVTAHTDAQQLNIFYCWLSSIMVRALDLQLTVHGFDS